MHAYLAYAIESSSLRERESSHVHNASDHHALIISGWHVLRQGCSLKDEHFMVVKQLDDSGFL